MAKTMSALHRIEAKVLASTRKAVALRQKRIAKAMFEIAEMMSAFASVLPDNKVIGFFGPECGLPRSDVRTYLKLAKLSHEDRGSIRKNVASFSTLKALVQVKPEARDEAMQRMAKGTRLGPVDITRIQRDQRLASIGADVLKTKQEASFFTRQARKPVNNIRDFRSRFTEFALSLEEFYFAHLDKFDDMSDAERTAFDQQCAEFKRTAAEALTQFEAIFDVSNLPGIWEQDCYTGMRESNRLARAYHALCDIAKGLFEPWSQGEDGERPGGISAGFVDPYYLDALLWLCGQPTHLNANSSIRPVPSSGEAPSVMPSTRLRSIELCAGAGGQALGLHSAGFDAQVLFERDKDAVATLRQNDWLGEVVAADIKQVDFSRYKDVDLIAGGVPCPGHSNAGKRKGRDDERDLFMEAVGIVGTVRPKAFFFENVKGFNEKPNADYRAELHGMLTDLGYDSRVFAFTGADLGLPQLRPRIALIGFRDGRMRDFHMPPIFPEWASTVGSAIGDLVRANGWEHADAWIEKANRLAPTILGGSHKSNATGFTTNYSKETMEALQLDPTRIADQAPPKGHPADAPFALTHAMAARMQAFPDDWNFHGNLQAKKRQIGNALPPIMARAVGLAIYSALTGEKFDYEQALQMPIVRSETLTQWRDRVGLNGGSRRYHHSQAAELEIQEAGDMGADWDALRA
ncbi:DNA (cytosine-5)-methyltransferase 1 [Rhizobium sp. PP-F2F-G48]|uniref:DNA cytosine methyltransferase n=1 Tax=Rhizobium sp. PP-F2F-G48 TaxID=2135651 RepID=UPI0010D54A73|nr:DNA (cytosine-5-)-methyltransferase [Rhizobium sp. PP-F2F-G48]TCM45369.1 DNA (cytosine-5)-methyltransferase 1 [Rhizobium sp. PP-F2F-G48]